MRKSSRFSENHLREQQVVGLLYEKKIEWTFEDRLKWKVWCVGNQTRYQFGMYDCT
ncbi:hypothetical protein M2454_000415 [Aequitasia blattaphilus]